MKFVIFFLQNVFCVIIFPFELYIYYFNKKNLWK